jgi:hypothetical protein
MKDAAYLYFKPYTAEHMAQIPTGMALKTVPNACLYL